MSPGEMWGRKSQINLNKALGLQNCRSTLFSYLLLSNQLSGTCLT